MTITVMIIKGFFVIIILLQSRYLFELREKKDTTALAKIGALTTKSQESNERIGLNRRVDYGKRPLAGQGYLQGDIAFWPT
jgi:hypothetical protein